MTKDDSRQLARWRKAAKRWFRALRSGDAAALERLERVLPRHAEALAGPEGTGE